MRQNIKPEQSDVLKLITSYSKDVSEFEFINFVPGSVVIFRYKNYNFRRIKKIFFYGGTDSFMFDLRVRPYKKVQEALKSLKNTAKSFLAFEFDSEIMSAVSNLDLNDLNHALYRCAEEDWEEGIGPYNIPGFGNLVYCGLQGTHVYIICFRFTKSYLTYFILFPL